jgi:NitT/TauT family transport system ATP-binding protein
MSTVGDVDAARESAESASTLKKTRSNLEKAESRISPQSIAVKDISVKYSSRRNADTHVLDRVNFTVRPSEFLAIVGPSGCGKSTLLKVVAGLIPPSAGSVTYGSSQTYRDQHIGFLFQADALMPWRTAADNVSIAFRLATGDRSRAHERSVELMTHLGLEGAADKYPHQLSGGMRKRVALARTLAYNPTVFLMDEPFGALDAQTRVTVGNFFLRILEESKQTVLFVTHDIEEAVTLADRVIVLSRGPGSSVIREFDIDLPRPRDYYESRFLPGSAEFQREIWASLRTMEVPE